MKVKVASLVIKSFQIEDLINIFLNNDYVVEIKNKDVKSFIVNVYVEKVEKGDE